MSVTPAQIANDLEAQARFFRGRDELVFVACMDAARAIRAALAGHPLSTSAWAEITLQLTAVEVSGLYPPGTQIRRSIERARRELDEVWGGCA